MKTCPRSPERKWIRVDITRVAGGGFEPPTSSLWGWRANRTATTPRHYLLGTHLRDASLFCYHYTTGCSLPTGIRTQTFSLTNKNLKKKIAVCISVTPEGIEPSSPPWEGGVLTAWLRSHIRFLCLFIFIRTLPSETGKPCFVLEWPRRDSNPWLHRERVAT